MGWTYHRDLIPQMPLQQLMRHEPLRTIALRINERDMMIHITDPLQLVRMTVMVRTAVYTDQENCDVRPAQAEKVEFKFIHIGCFAVEEE